MKESTLEKKIKDYAKLNSWLTYKFVSPSKRGVPDRIFIRKGVVIFIEFKSKNKKPSLLQLKNINDLKSEDIQVYVVDDFNTGKAILDTYDT